ncbi:hypothetical protein AAHE18_13G035500 [Arachis hypogaea]
MAMKSVIIMLLIIGVVMCFVLVESNEIIPKESSTPSYYIKIQHPRDDSSIPAMRRCIDNCIEKHWPHPETKTRGCMLRTMECAQNCVDHFIRTLK